MEINSFVILILAHFISDYFFQPTWWGMNKPGVLGMKTFKEAKYTILHSMQYSIIFIPFLYFLNISMWWFFYLVITHFIVDSYIPLRLWNKHVKNAIGKVPDNEPPSSIVFKQDQILHILLLIPLAL